MSSVVHNLESKIEQVISYYEVPTGLDKKEVLNEILAKIEEGNTKQQRASRIFFLSPVYRIAISTAASLLLIFLLHFFLSTIKVSCEDLVAGSYLFPDESRAIMGFDSKMSYPRYWWKREISLTGDAYFEVKKDRRFTVKTKYGKIEVVGTRFHVRQLKNGLRIQCYEGMVKLSTSKLERLIPEGNYLELRNDKVSKISKITAGHPGLAKFNP